MNHVLYACDRNFLEPLYTSVYSLLCHIREENTYVIHMILKDVEEAEKTKIQEMGRKFHQEIIFYDSPPLSGKLNISDIGVISRVSAAMASTVAAEAAVPLMVMLIFPEIGRAHV